MKYFRVTHYSSAAYSVSQIFHEKPTTNNSMIDSFSHHPRKYRAIFKFFFFLKNSKNIFSSTFHHPSVFLIISHLLLWEKWLISGSYLWELFEQYTSWFFSFFCHSQELEKFPIRKMFWEKITKHLKNNAVYQKKIAMFVP